MEDAVGLQESRERLQEEIYRALSCRSKKQKLALVAEWKQRYGEVHVRELISVVKNKPVAYVIVNWKIEEM